MKRITALTAFVSLIIAASAQNSVLPVDETSSTDGIYYSLPQTILHVEVEVEKKTFYAGPLAAYADDFLGREDVLTQDETTYRITEVTLSSSSQPDPDQFYFVEFKPEELKESRRFVMALDESGLLTGLNAKPAGDERKSKKTVVKAEGSEVDKAELFDFVAVKGRALVKDTLIRMITVDTSVKKDIRITERWETRTKEEMASEVVQRLQKIQQDRYYLSIGYQETAYDEGAIKYMDGRLKKRQKEYTALFTGKTVTSRERYSFEWIPGSDTRKSAENTLCKFSVHSGIRDANSSIGKSLILRADNANTTKNILQHSKLTLQTGKKHKGVYYRIPDFASVSVIMDDERLVNQRMRINQFGVVSYTPWSQEMDFELHPQSGALKNIELFYRD